ncbi:hypothetical protein JCM3263A_04290 [Thermobifida fusca]|jgi:hypothetical protein|uniref:DUF695 domain-containing protein n=2 Tax=Thermobifida fusca TaxID=2021 RepID=A0A9P2TDD1_THEFU|nr:MULTISPECIES: DUF695 domain-containing protein [Thermobifida]AAZ54634.1 hypothetical protein Tfu_0596 [Thermobifida fusca YX]EOR72295.1 hypothetical protein TM51_03347 [Thermobifida fusca TM51]MBO2529504.1 DUF695 domain-containing protein [Thermobifida sp.]MDD6793702.1 DUF695 domain-containing protein [Thermobifida fusca]PPS93041.1 hypothetical protein BH05_09010 [Thermobifida fusca]
MALFRRRRSDESAVAIDDFWSGWGELRSALAASIDEGAPVPAEVAQQLDERVQRIHPSLTWEVSRAPEPAPTNLASSPFESLDSPEALLASLDAEPASARASYALTLRAGDDDEARVLAERWYRAAPEDAEWTFFPARPADHAQLSRTITWHDHELDLSHVSVSMRVNHATGKIEAGVYHPDFMFLPEETQREVAEHVMLLAVGEDDMVRWVDSVKPLVEKPLDPLPPTSVPAVVRQLSGMSGGGGWVTLQGRIPLRGAMQLSARHPLHRRDYPALTLYVQVVASYTEADKDRLPTGSSAAALESYALRLREMLGANGALFAVQTLGGQRVFHFYLDPESGIFPEFEKAAREWSEGQASVTSELDPEWRIIEQLLKPIRKQLGR